MPPRAEGAAEREGPCPHDLRATDTTAAASRRPGLRRRRPPGETEAWPILMVPQENSGARPPKRRAFAISVSRRSNTISPPSCRPARGRPSSTARRPTTQAHISVSTNRLSFLFALSRNMRALLIGYLFPEPPLHDLEAYSAPRRSLRRKLRTTLLLYVAQQDRMTRVARGRFSTIVFISLQKEKNPAP